MQSTIRIFNQSPFNPASADFVLWSMGSSEIFLKISSMYMLMSALL